MRQQSSSRFDRNDRSDRNDRPERNFGSSQSSSRRNEWNSDRMSGDYSEFGNNQDRDLSGSTYGSYGNEDQYRYSGAERGDRSQRWDRSNRSDRMDRSDRGERGHSEMYQDMNQDRYMTDSDRYNQRYGSSQGSETFSSSGRDIEGGGYGSQTSRNSSWPSSERFGSSQDRYGSSQDRYGSQSPSRGRHEGKGPKGFKRSDDRIKEEICEMLTRDPSIDASEIDIEVKDGEVTLTGSVPDRRMKHLAEDCVDRSFGVRDVTNQIRVKREGSMTSSSSDLAESSSSRSSSSSSSSSNPTSGSKRASSSSSLS